METGITMSSEMDIQKFWSRRIAGPHYDEVTTADVLLENQVLFPPAQVQVEDEIAVTKSRPSSPFCPPCDQFCFKEEVCSCQDLDKESVSAQVGSVTQLLDAASLGDIPCRYRVPKSESHEMTAVGVYVDPRIIPGFKYKIRPLSHGGKKQWLFGGAARELESIGRGYSRRVTLKPLTGNINSNPDYFWTDSNDAGFAFSLQVVSPGDRFTLFDADHQPVAHLELTQLQGPQVQISQNVLKVGRIEKVVRVRALCKVDWFHEQDNNPIVQISGLCVAELNEGKCSVVHIRDARVGLHTTRYGYTLTPGTCSSLRSLRVSGANISDIPTSYTIVGIEPYHLPVIGTYVDERVVPGFHYRVQLGGCGKKLFSGRPMRLDSIGCGYAKRITFEPNRLNSPDNHFWSDSNPEGYGFETSAVRPGMEFVIKTRDCLSVVGHAAVFRDDHAPQIEIHHSIVEEENGVGVLKKVQVNVKCEVSLDMSTKDEYTSHIMRVSGTAILYKPPKQAEAKILKIEDIGLDSQLSMIFTNQLQELVFLPFDKLSSAS